jgi:cytochrome c55X
LSEKSDEVLVAAILHGRPGTPMAPWAFALSERETEWLVNVLRKGDLDAR